MGKRNVTIKGDDDDIGYKVFVWAGADCLRDEHTLVVDHIPHSGRLTRCGSLHIDTDEPETARSLSPVEVERLME
ncbi:MAG TPA: hypothetical protein VIL09_12705 [Microvirga sp.]|jgi:hypothetical protein